MDSRLTHGFPIADPRRRSGSQPSAVDVSPPVEQRAAVAADAEAQAVVSHETCHHAVTCEREGADPVTCGLEGADPVTCGREEADPVTRGREGADPVTCGREGANVGIGPLWLVENVKRYGFVRILKFVDWTHFYAILNLCLGCHLANR